MTRIEGPSDRTLRLLAQRAGRALATRGWRVATAESCTGGWVAKALTDVPGSSDWVECGYVVYSNTAKMRDLKVPAAILRAHGAVSEATVRAMASGAAQRARTHLAVAISGIAGPGGGTADKPVGTVWFGFAIRQRRIATSAACQLFSGDREAVRRKSVHFALKWLIEQAAP